MYYLACKKKMIGTEIQIIEGGKQVAIPAEDFNKQVANLIHGGSSILVSRLDDTTDQHPMFTSSYTQPYWEWKPVQTPPDAGYYRKMRDIRAVSGGGKITYFWFKPITKTWKLATAEDLALSKKKVLKSTPEIIQIGHDRKEACYRKNLIPFEQFHKVSVEYAIFLMKWGVWFQCNDPKIRTEAKAQIQLDKDIEGIRCHVPKLKYTMTPDELDFYRRAFSVNVPNYAVSDQPVHTERTEYYMSKGEMHAMQVPAGFAICPSFRTDDFNKYVVHRKGEAPYAGNGLESRPTPVTLIRDARNISMDLNHDARLQEQIEYFLDMPEWRKADFLAPGFEIQNGKVVEVPLPTEAEDRQIAMQYQVRVRNPHYDDPSAQMGVSYKALMNAVTELPAEHRNYVLQKYGFIDDYADNADTSTKDRNLFLEEIVLDELRAKLGL